MSFINTDMSGSNEWRRKREQQSGNYSQNDDSKTIVNDDKPKKKETRLYKDADLFKSKLTDKTKDAKGDEDKRDSLVNDKPARFEVKGRSENRPQKPWNLDHKRGRKKQVEFYGAVRKAAKDHNIRENAVGAINYYEQAYRDDKGEHKPARNPFGLSDKDTDTFMGYYTPDKQDEKYRPNMIAKSIKAVSDRMEYPTIAKVATLLYEPDRDEVSSHGQNIADIYHAFEEEEREGNGKAIEPKQSYPDLQHAPGGTRAETVEDVHDKYDRIYSLLLDYVPKQDKLLNQKTKQVKQVNFNTPYINQFNIDDEQNIKTESQKPEYDDYPPIPKGKPIEFDKGKMEKEINRLNKEMDSEILNLGLYQMAVNTMKGETGENIDFETASKQIVTEYNGTKSYGWMGLNSLKNNPAHVFAKKYGEDLGLKGTPGTDEFDESWLKAVDKHPKKIMKAQFEFYDSEMLREARQRLKNRNLEKFMNDPRVLSYLADSITLVSGGTTGDHMSAIVNKIGRNIDAMEFIKALAKHQIEQLPISNKSSIEKKKGLENRINGRVNRAKTFIE